jgi:tRNA(Ile)-lysidine synthase
MRRPVQQQQTRAGHHRALLFSEPANVPAVDNRLRHPRLVVLVHDFQHLIVAPPRVHEHAVSMTRDQSRVACNRQPRSQHGKQYKSYDGCVTAPPQLDRTGLHAGLRVSVAVSGGADSVALLRALATAAPEIGLVLSVAHVHHGIRGAEADEDARFVEHLALERSLPFDVHRVDTPSVAARNKQSIEEAGRELRYAWFRSLLAESKADAVATAHTLDDQAETVLHRLLRGAWTEGLSGIHPVLRCERGTILRPLLAVRRSEIEAWLHSLGQPWRDDATNAETTYTRNRIRHEVLPLLAQLNPRVAEQLAHLAAIARDEEIWWETELDRLLPSLVLPGRPVRGGGRAVSTHPEEASVGMELERLRALAPALRRRVLRAAAKQLGCRLDFEQTERLMAMAAADSNAAGAKKQQLAADLCAECSLRELRLIRTPAKAVSAPDPQTFELPIPGEVTGLGVTLRAILVGNAPAEPIPPAILRTPRPGDRVHLKHSRGPKPLKEIFERMGVAAATRKSWPLIEWQGRIVWIRGADVEATTPFCINTDGKGER